MGKKFGGIVSFLLIVLSIGYFQVSEAQAAGVTASNATELIDAINAANLTPEADIINLTGNIAFDSSFLGSLATPYISSEIIIYGNGYTISRSPSMVSNLSFFAVQSTGSFWLHDLTLTRASNGAISVNGGRLTLTRVNIIDNISSSYGGGILMRGGELTLVESSVSDNTLNHPIDGYGGGIYVENNAIINIVLSEISRNSLSSRTSSGVGLYADSGSVITVYNSRLENNIGTAFSTAFGGGMYINFSSLRLLNSTVSNNSTTGSFSSGGGGLSGVFTDLYIQASEINHNTVTTHSAGGYGGGLEIHATTDATLNIFNSTFSNNSVIDLSRIPSIHGGGILIGVTRDFLIENTAIVNNLLQINGTGGVSSVHGGGLDVSSGSGVRVVRNSTISGNVIEKLTSHSHAFRLVGAGVHTNGQIELSFVTIVNNLIDDPSRPSMTTAGLSTGRDPVIINSSIITNNIMNGWNANCLNSVASTGYNLMGTNSVCRDFVTTDILDVDMILNPLANNGGLTPTHAITLNPPIDSADPTNCPPTDQRGAPRPQGAGCDIGAYEANSVAPVFNTAPVQSFPNYVVTYATPNNTAYSDNLFTRNTVIDAESHSMETFPITPPQNGSLELNLDGTFTYTPSGTFSGTDTFQYIICDEIGYCSDVISVAIQVDPVVDPVYFSNHAPGSTLIINEAMGRSMNLYISNIGGNGSSLDVTQVGASDNFTVATPPTDVYPSDGPVPLTISCTPSASNVTETFILQTNEPGSPQYRYTLLCEAIPTPTPTYTPSFTPTLTPSATPTVTLTPTNTPTPTSTLTPTATWTITPTIAPDVNLCFHNIVNITENTNYRGSAYNDGTDILLLNGSLTAGYEMVIWDAITNTFTPIENVNAQRFGGFSNGRVVWYTIYPFRVYLWDGTQTRLLQTSDRNTAPVISDTLVAWSYNDGYDNEIAIWNGSGRFTNLSDNWFISDTRPQLDGNNLVWVAQPTARGSDIMFWDGNTITQITNDGTTDDYPQISGTNVAWLRDSIQDVMFWDGTTITQVSDFGFRSYGLQIDGSTLVWYGGETTDQQEIYFWDYRGIIQVTSNSFQDNNPQISGSNIVWQGFDGNDWEIFHWSPDTGVITQITDNDVDDSGVQINGTHVTWSQGASSVRLPFYLDLSNCANATPTPTATYTPTLTSTGTVTASASPTLTSTYTPTATAFLTPEITPEVTPEITPEVTPELTPEITPEITPEVTPEITPEVMPEVTPEITPEITPEVTPEITPEITPEVTPEITPEVTREITPEVTPELTVQPTNDASVQSAQSANVATAEPSLELFDPAISKIGFLQPGQVGVTGEQIEWIVSVRNTGNVAGMNVTITDTLVSQLRVDNVDAPGGNVSINGQTVTVSYPVLNVGQSVQFSIFTTVLDGAEIENTVCVTASNQGDAECFTGSVISTLPETGQNPFWKNWLFWLMGSLLIFVAGTGIFLYRR